MKQNNAKFFSSRHLLSTMWKKLEINLQAMNQVAITFVM